MLEIRAEAAAAAAWWADLLRAAGTGVAGDRLEEFERVLALRIESLCQDAAWRPDIPTYGSCGRQVGSDPRPDDALVRAGRTAGVAAHLGQLPPAVMWVNPGEVVVEAAGDHAPTQVWPPPMR